MTKIEELTKKYKEIRPEIIYKSEYEYYNFDKKNKKFEINNELMKKYGVTRAGYEKFKSEKKCRVAPGNFNNSDNINFREVEIDGNIKYAILEKKYQISSFLQEAINIRDEIKEEMLKEIGIKQENKKFIEEFIIEYEENYSFDFNLQENLDSQIKTFLEIINKYKTDDFFKKIIDKLNT